MAQKAWKKRRRGEAQKKSLAPSSSLLHTRRSRVKWKEDTVHASLNTLLWGMPLPACESQSHRYQKGFPVPNEIISAAPTWPWGWLLLLHRAILSASNSPTESALCLLWGPLIPSSVHSAPERQCYLVLNQRVLESDGHTVNLIWPWASHFTLLRLHAFSVIWRI